MIINVTITHTVEAPSWDLAVEAVLKDPLKHISGCKVKAPGYKLVHVAPSNVRYAASNLGRGGT